MGTKKALKQVSSGREEICLQMLCKFLFDVRNCWYATASVSHERNAGKYVGKKTWHFSLCNLDGSVKVLKLMCGVWKEVIFWKQKITQSNLSLA